MPLLDGFHQRGDNFEDTVKQRKRAVVGRLTGGPFLVKGEDSSFRKVGGWLIVGEQRVDTGLEGGAPAFCAAADCDPVSGYKAGAPVSAIVVSVNANTYEVLVSINKFEEIKDRKRMAQYLKAPPPLTLGQLLSPEKND